jgi:hypothetical protein
MNQAVNYWLEITGTALVLAWIFRNPDAFNRLTTAISSVSVSSVQVLQGR